MTYLRGPQCADELDLWSYRKLVFKYAHRYANLLGLDDAVGIAWLGLVRARDAWKPELAPFAKIAPYYIRAALNDEAERALKRNGVPARLRKNGRRRVYHLRPHDEVEVTLVSANQDGDDGQALDLFDTIADPAPDPEHVLLARERRYLIDSILAGVDPDDRQRAEAILTGDARDGRLPEATRRRLRAALAEVEDR